MTKVRLIRRNMLDDEFKPLCFSMLSWLKERKISYVILDEDWYDLPTMVWIHAEEDAIIFKLTFGL